MPHPVHHHLLTVAPGDPSWYPGEFAPTLNRQGTPFPYLHDVTRRFLRFRNDGMRQPGIAHRMYALFKEAGLTGVLVVPLAQVTTDYETIRPVAHLMEGMRLAQEQCVVTAEEAEQWIRYLEEAIRTGRFFEAMTWFITIGRTPI
jgi:hypothetical protein